MVRSIYIANRSHRTKVRARFKLGHARSGKEFVDRACPTLDAAFVILRYGPVGNPACTHIRAQQDRGRSTEPY